MNLSNVFKKIREEKELTQGEMGEILEITQKGYQKKELGERKFALEDLERLLEHFKISLSDLEKYL